MHGEFFKIVAQIIPVFILAISVQSGFDRRDYKYKKSEQSLLIAHIGAFALVALVLVIAEFVCLRNIYTNSTGSFDVYVVGSALCLSMIYIVADFVGMLMGKRKEFTFVLFNGVILAVLISYLAIVVYSIAHTDFNKELKPPPKIELKNNR